MLGREEGDKEDPKRVVSSPTQNFRTRFPKDKTKDKHCDGDPPEDYYRLAFLKAWPLGKVVRESLSCIPHTDLSQNVYNQT